jgi:hypothetical protein
MGLVYTDKKRIHAHRDNLWSKDGKFSHHLNSQMENTYSVILVLGDPRVLKFQLFQQTKKKQSLADSEAAVQTFTFSHGTLFLLHPRDEASVIRNFFEDHGITFFKHSSPGVCDGAMSLGLVFRTVCHSHEVDKLTGQLVSGQYATTNHIFTECEAMINTYMQSEQSTIDDDKLKYKWYDCKHTHFKT